MSSEKQWRFRQNDQHQIQQIQEVAKVSPLVAQLLAGRGLTSQDEIQKFLHGKLTDLRPPHELPGVTEATMVISKALREKSRICVYGDYDVDGMTSCAILVQLLIALSADVIYYIPNRLDEGYGLNQEAIQDLASRGIDLIITVDCGIGSVHEVALAKELGLDVIITDHHQVGSELPKADAIVHPALPNTHYPFHGLCGAGVAFKLAWAVSQAESPGDRASPMLRKLLMRSLGLAALGTIADVVPLVDENRTLVKFGLHMLKEDPFPGLEALLKVTKLHKKDALATEDVGFMIGPRLNAAGRLGYARLGAELLMTGSHERAQTLAEHIDNLNQDREKLERKIYHAARQQVFDDYDPEENAALVLGSNDWHVGVIGIVAGRVAERFNRPTVLVSLDKSGLQPGTGSARSACGIDLHEAFSECAEHLTKYGGHAAAAGLKIAEEKLAPFRIALCEYVEANLTTQDTRPILNIEIEAVLSQLTVQTVRELECLAPFGSHNARPVVCTSQVHLSGPPKKMGRGERHLSLQLEQSGVKIRAVAFGKGEWCEELEKQDGPIDIAYRPVINDFAGRRNVEIHLIDWRVCESASLQAST